MPNCNKCNAHKYCDLSVGSMKMPCNNTYMEDLDKIFAEAYLEERDFYDAIDCYMLSCHAM